MLLICKIIPLSKKEDKINLDNLKFPLLNLFIEQNYS